MSPTRIGRSSLRWAWIVGVFVLFGLVLPFSGATADQRKELTATWLDHWVLLKSELYSTCTDSYTPTRIEAGRATRPRSRLGDRLLSLAAAANPNLDSPPDEAEERRFAPGEIGRVRKIKVRGSRVDFAVELEARVLDPWEHGGFTHYHPARCRVEVQIRLAKEILKKGGADLDRALAEVMELHGSVDLARSSPLWNGRPEEAYPEDYARTMEAYGQWRQRAIDRGVAESMATLRELAIRLRTDPVYVEDLAEGVTRMRPLVESAPCERLIGASDRDLLDSRLGGAALGGLAFAEDPGEGVEDGQRLAFAVLALERLEGCRTWAADSPPDRGER